MAAAEARAVWQRTSNRYLVQEDAKRAPKLACCPSSNAQNDTDSENVASARDYIVPSFMPMKRNAMNANLLPETKWWLQMQPNFGYQKESIHDQLSPLECEHDEEMETEVTTLESDGKSIPVASGDCASKKEDCFMESPWTVSTASMKRGSENRLKDMKTTTNSQQPLKRKNAMDDHLCKEEDPLDLKTIDRLTPKRPGKASQDFETPWPGTNKSEPWWRITDKDELALLVAQKSLQHFENCDLPKPSQTVHVAGDEKFDAGGKFQSSLNRNLNASISNANECSHDSSTSWMSNDKNFSSGAILHDPEKSYSYIRDYVQKEQPEQSANDLSRAELLEALRHSQTRAREAEIAAQKAYHEKEHIVKLLFRQASHLFAYKQWIQMLQIQNLVLQLKSKDHQMPYWMPSKRKLSDKEKKLRRDRKKHKCYLCRYAVIFAVGLGLAGAGLLFGLTFGIGWLFPEP